MKTPPPQIRGEDVLSPWEWMAPLTAVAVLVPVSQWNYLLFHVSAELFIAAVGLMLYFIASSVANYGRSHFMLVLGAGFFWVSVVEVFHTIAYKGMGILFHGSANEATQLWVTARLLEGLALALAPLFIGKRVKPCVPFLAFGALALLACGSVIAGVFPDSYLEPNGLTPFKVAMEWVTIALFGLSGLLLHRRRHELPARPYHLLLMALALSTTAELAFTLYTGIYAHWNIVGHILIFLAFWMLFLATVKTMMTEPFVHVTRDATILELSPDPTVLITKDSKVTRMNRAAEQAFGKRPEPGTLPLWDLVGPEGEWNRSRSSLEDDPRRPEGAIPTQTTLRRKTVWYDVRIRPLWGSVLGQSAIVVFRDITASKEAEEILRQSNVELEQFAHVLSHELQTPIRGMVSHLGVIRHRLGDRLEGDLVQDMDLTMQAGKRMSAMIHGLLDYANARPSDHPLKPIPLDLALSDAMAGLGGLTRERNALITLPHGLPDVLGNRDQLAHVFQQILDNGCRYVPAGRRPEVSVAIRETDEQVILSFSDNGLGIADKDRQVIFGVFKRLNAEADYPGTGLGLAIAKRLVELHGGRIGIAPRQDGPGSVFTVTLWKASARAYMPLEAPADQDPAPST
jgi:PAS domain S-box-containing protein